MNTGALGRLEGANMGRVVKSEFLSWWCFNVAYMFGVGRKKEQRRWWSCIHPGADLFRSELGFFLFLSGLKDLLNLDMAE